MKYNVKLIRKEEVAKGTTAFEFEKPQGFIYKAGQHADWNLINPPETDAEGMGRCFTLSSAPDEEFLMITTRMRNTAYKRILGKMAIGSEIELDGPRGMLTLPIDISKRAVLLAGGIGVTPFRSMVHSETHDQSPRKIWLFYSNRHPEDGPFLEELSELKNPNFTFVPIITKPEGVRGWAGEKGHINWGMIQRYLGNEGDEIFYTAGPSEMTNAMNEMLIGAGVPLDNIKIEEFPGY